MFAIVEIKGKQYRVEKGMIVDVDKLKENEEGDKLKIDQVLLKSDGETTEIGTPTISGSYVEIVVKEHRKADKIKVYKKKPKKRYERTQGHRQAYTRVEVLNVK